jgi:predicted nucleotidyltransferase
MRITRSTLHKIAKDTVAQRVKSDSSVMAALLVGSALSEDPFIGHTTDIDIVFVCINEPETARQIVKLTNEISLDLYFIESTAFEPARKLRTDPLLGYMMYDSLPLFETQHFFEYTQAIVRAGFDEPVNVLARARQHSLPARELWMELTLGGSSRPQDVLRYFKAVYHAANAVAGLSGPPLTDRRFLLEFESRVEAIERPELYAALLNLLGGPATNAGELESLIPAWTTAYHVAENGADLLIHPDRLSYHHQALETLLKGDKPMSALWLFIHTWTAAAASLVEYGPEYVAWKAFFERLGLVGAGFEEKVQALDRFLDATDEMLDTISADYGLS